MLCSPTDPGREAQDDERSPATVSNPTWESQRSVAAPDAGPPGDGPGPEPPTSGGPSGPRRHLHLVRLASWNVLDQVLSALTNIVLAILVAHHVGREGFGAFAVAILVFNVCIGIERALVGQPMSIRYSSAGGARLHSGRSRAMGTALAVGLGGSLGCLAAGVLLGGQLGSVLIATGAVMPFLMMQDAARLIFFARSQAKLAAVNDALWAVIQFGGILLLPLLATPTASNLVLVWGGAAAACVVVALSQLSVLPDLRGARSWLREHRDISGYLLAEYLLGAGAFQGGILAVGALIGGSEGLAIIGAFKAAQVVLGPLNMLATALQTFALPELSKRHWLTGGQRWRVALGLGGFMATVAATYSVVLLLLPESAGRVLFSESWDGARDVLLPMALGATAGMICQGCALVIYSMGLARRTFRIMSVEAPLVFSLMITGAVTGGAVGAAWGMCLDQVSLVPLWFWTLRGVLRDSSSVSAAARNRG
jgi:O-antigen/teichoic acid export membrane protein